MASTKVTTAREEGTGGDVEKGFQEELEGVMLSVQTGFRRLLAEWGKVDRPAANANELDRMSGAGATICWRVFRVATADEPVSEARNVPTPTSLKRLLNAGAKAGVSEKTLRVALEATQAFEAFAKRTATDKATLNSILAGASTDQEVEKIQMSERRAAYRALSHIWGAQTEMRYVGNLIRRSKSGNGTDAIYLSSLVNLRRLRPDRSIELYSTWLNASGSATVKPDGLDRWEAALEPEVAAQWGLPLLPGFSKQPFPKVDRVIKPSGVTQYTTRDMEVGVRGEITLSLGQVYRESEFAVDEDGRRLYHFTTNFGRQAIGLQYQEVIIHRPSFPNVRPELLVYDMTLPDRSQKAAREAEQYPVDEKIVRVGRADQAGLTDLPTYGEMWRYAAGKLGWDLSEFDVWRVRNPYPITLSSTRIFFYVD